MRITVEIDEATLKAIKKRTKIDKNSPAISFVVSDWVRQKDRRAFLDKVLNGETDYSMTNDELERRLYGTSD